MVVWILHLESLLNINWWVLQALERENIGLVGSDSDDAGMGKGEPPTDGGPAGTPIVKTSTLFTGTDIPAKHFEPSRMWPAPLKKKTQAELDLYEKLNSLKFGFGFQKFSPVACRSDHLVSACFIIFLRTYLLR